MLIQILKDLLETIVYILIPKVFMIQQCIKMAFIQKNKTEVSIKELRNILAKDHLKDGDVVIASIGSNKYIVEVKSITERINGAFINARNFLTLHEDGSISEINNGGAFSDFIRYATEEEKSLLEPVNSFTESDIAIVERLHDTLLDNHGYSLQS